MSVHLSAFAKPACRNQFDLGWRMTSEPARVTCGACRRTARFRRRRRHVKGNF